MEQQPRRSGSHSDSASPAADSFPLVAGKQSSSDFSMAQINSSGIHGRAIASAPPYEAGGGSSTASGVAPGSISGAGMSLASSPLPSPSRDIAGTGKVSRIGSRETDLSSMGGVGRARGGGASVGGTGAGSGSTASGGAGVVAAAMADDGAMRQTSPRDTRETNPLYKSVAPLSRTPRVSGEVCRVGGIRVVPFLVSRSRRFCLRLVTRDSDRSKSISFAGFPCSSSAFRVLFGLGFRLSVKFAYGVCRGLHIDPWTNLIAYLYAENRMQDFWLMYEN